MILAKSVPAPFDETVPAYTRVALEAAYPYVQEIRVRAVDRVDGPVDGLLVASIAPVLGDVPGTRATPRMHVAAFCWAAETSDGTSYWTALFSGEGFARPHGELRHLWFGDNDASDVGYLYDVDGTTRKVLTEALASLGKWFD